MNDFLHFLIQIFQRSMALAVGAVAVGAAALALAYILFRRANGREKRFPWLRAVAALALLGWLAVVLYATLMRFGAGGVPLANFHLFMAWREAWNGWSLQGWLNVLLNTAMFLPLGVLAPVLLGCFQKWYWMLALGFGSSLVIEAAQYLSGRGLFDVDDLFCNTLGAMLGFCLVMFLRKLCRREGLRSLPYLSGLLVYGVVLALIFGGYQLKELGNLQEAPTYTQNTRGIHWKVNCDLDDRTCEAPVYRTEPLDRAGGDAFAEQFAQKADITFPDVSYYDHSAIYMNHSSGDFLELRYRDGSYEYTVGCGSKTQIWDLPHTETDVQVLRDTLAKYDIHIPSSAEHRFDGYDNVLTVHMEQDGDSVRDGFVRVTMREGDLVQRIDNRLVTFRYYRHFPILTQQEAYEKLTAGKFGGADLQRRGGEEIWVLDCRLEYRVDTKGFYQPVYAFDVDCGGDVGTVLVPALK